MVTKGRSGGTPTLEEVAALAGVGRGTVSRVINNAPGVRGSTRTAVQRAIAELGYVPNSAARALASHRADAVALVIPEGLRRLFAEPFFSDIVHGVDAGLADTGLHLLLTLVRDERERHQFVQFARAGRVDGVLLVSVHDQDPLPEMLAQVDLPMVLCGRRAGEESVSYVDCDNVDGARSAVRHLAAAGCRAVATIAGPHDLGAARGRLRGYREAAADLFGDTDAACVARGDFTEESGRRAMAELLLLRPQLDGVFVASDVMAAGALQALRTAGRRVPEDVAVVGFDDAPLAQHTEPPLTTVRQPVEAMGRSMARMLVEELRDPGASWRHLVLRTELVVRASA